jgi:hypothetical protein
MLGLNGPHIFLHLWSKEDAKNRDCIQLDVFGMRCKKIRYLYILWHICLFFKSWNQPWLTSIEGKEKGNYIQILHCSSSRGKQKKWVPRYLHKPTLSSVTQDKGGYMVRVGRLILFSDQKHHHLGYVAASYSFALCFIFDQLCDLSSFTLPPWSTPLHGSLSLTLVRPWLVICEIFLSHIYLYLLTAEGRQQYHEENGN